MASAKIWTEDKIEQVRQWVNEGLTSKEIAAKLGTTVPAVDKVRRRNKIYSPNPHIVWDMNKLEQLYKLWSAGYSDTKISKIMGIDKVKIYRARLSYGFNIEKKPKKQKPEPEPKPVTNDCREYTYNTDVLIMQFLTEGYAVNYIANMLGRNIESLQDYIKHNKSRLMRAHQNMMNYNGVYAHRCNKKRKEY